MKTLFAGLVSVVAICALAGCVVVPAQYATDENGKRVMVQPERLVPAPITINAFPVVPMVVEEPVYYGPAPMYYRPTVVYDPWPVVYRRPVVVREYPHYYGPTVVVTRPTRTVVIGGHGGGGHRGPHRR